MHKGGAVSAPSRYGSLISVMERMHWSWQDLKNAPADLIEEIIQRIQSESRWRHEKAAFDAQMAGNN